MKKFKRITALVLALVMLTALSVFIRTDVAAAVSLEMTDATVIEANKISVGFTAAKVGNATAAITVRIVDADGNLVRSATEGNALEWKGDINYTTWPNAPMVSKITNAVTVDSNSVNTAEGILALTEGAYSDCTPLYILRESKTGAFNKNVVATKNNGLVDSFFAINNGENKVIEGTNPSLTANATDAEGWDEVRITLARPATFSIGEIIDAGNGKLTINFSSEKVGNAGATTGVRIVDAAGATLTNESGTKLQWGVSMAYTAWPSAPMTGSITGSVTYGGTEVTTLAGIRELAETLGGKAVFYIKEGTTAAPAKNVAPVKGNGLIDSYFAINNGNNAYLKYVNPALTASGKASDGWDELTVEILDPAPSLSITEIVATEANKMTVNFDAAKVGNAGATTYVRIVDASGKTMTHGGVTLQWNADMNYVTWPNTPMISKITNSLTVDGNAINTVEGVRALAKQIGGTAVFVLREATLSNAGKNTIATKNNGLIDSYFANNDGSNKYVYRVNPSLTANSVDGDGWDCLTLEILSPAKTLELTEVTAIDTNKLQIDFSAAKIGNAGALAKLVILDRNGMMMVSATEGTDLCWSLGMDYITWPNAPMIATVTDSLIVDDNGISTVAQIMELAENYGGTATFVLREGTTANTAKNVTPVKDNGLIDSYFANNDGSNKYIARENPALTANAVDENGWDVIICEVLPPSPKLTVTSVSGNVGGLTVNFDAEKIGNAGAYATLVIEGTNLSWELEMGYTTWPDSPMKATVKGEAIANILAMVGEGGAHEGKQLLFVLKESTKSNSDKNVTATKGNGLIDSYFAINDGNNKYVERVNPSLTANGVSADGWDTLTIPVDVTFSPTVALEKVEVISDTRLLITFSEPITMKGNAWAGLRVVDENYKLMYYNNGESPLQWYGRANKQGYPFEWANEEHTQIYWTFRAVNTMGLNTIGQVLRAEGSLGEVMQENWQIVFCFEEKSTDDFKVTTANGLIDSVTSADGRPVKPTVIKNGWNDGVYIKVEGEAPADTLEVVSVKTLSDTRILVTLSAPVEMEVSPYGAIRLVNDTNALQYRENEDGTKTPIQWGGAFEYYNEEKTQLVWQIYGNQRNFGDLNNIPDILAFKGLPEEWKEYTFKFCIEEKGSAALSADNHINNITLASDMRVHLSGNKPNMAGYDGHYAEIEYTLPAQGLTASAAILNDRQVMLSFSAPVEILGDPWFGIRLVKDGKLAWSGEENKSTALQWKGTWEWANEAHTRILWTINGSSTYGIYNVYDILTYGGGLAPFKDSTTINWCIEEKKTDDFQGLISYDQRIENIVSTDGTRHLIGSYCQGYDGLFLRLSDAALLADTLQVASVTAVDDMTLEVKFTEPVKIAEGDAAPAMTIRYLTDSGDTHALTDGRSAAFGGTWAWKDDTHDTILWTLNLDKARGADNLTDIFTFADQFKYSSDANITFCINMTEDNVTSTYSMRIDGITDTAGKRALLATRFAEICVSQTPIDIAYELPVIAEPEPEIEEPTVTVTDYKFAMIGAATLTAVGLVLGIVFAAKKKEEDR